VTLNSASGSRLDYARSRVRPRTNRVSQFLTSPFFPDELVAHLFRRTYQRSIFQFIVPGAYEILEIIFRAQPETQMKAAMPRSDIRASGQTRPPKFHIIVEPTKLQNVGELPFGINSVLPQVSDSVGDTQARGFVFLPKCDLVSDEIGLVLVFDL
jgi:hypothetical protein